MKLLKVILLATAFVFAADYAMAQGTIDGVVFNDADGDGVADPGELVESGVTVSLVDAAGNVIATVVTDANGAYFDNDTGQFASPHPDARDPGKCQDVVRSIETILAALT